jgi:hypothetical protein
MSFATKASRLYHVLQNVRRYPRQVAEVHLQERARALAGALAIPPPDDANPCDDTNPLAVYFDGVTTGPGIWKWRHYFDIYHRHFERFRHQSVVVAEVGVYSGGSLLMWRAYFGAQAEIHGIDIEPACRVYAGPHTTIHTGDQADRAFWRRFRAAVPRLDILIDDGGHLPEQQMVTLEEVLPHLAPGGVYLCEDIHGREHLFARWIFGLADELNHTDSTDPLAHQPSALQAQIAAITCYPYVAVIEKRRHPLTILEAPPHGTEWWLGSPRPPG